MNYFKQPRGVAEDETIKLQENFIRKPPRYKSTSPISKFIDTSPLEDPFPSSKQTQPTYEHSPLEYAFQDDQDLLDNAQFLTRKRSEVPASNKFSTNKLNVYDYLDNLDLTSEEDRQGVLAEPPPLQRELKAELEFRELPDYESLMLSYNGLPATDLSFMNRRSDKKRMDLLAYLKHRRR